jgi:hypothetical protein
VLWLGRNVEVVLLDSPMIKVPEWRHCIRNSVTKGISEAKFRGWNNQPSGLSQ